jgi:hypothetical protein
MGNLRWCNTTVAKGRRSEKRRPGIAGGYLSHHCTEWVGFSGSSSLAFCQTTSERLHHRWSHSRPICSWKVSRIQIGHSRAFSSGHPYVKLCPLLPSNLTHSGHNRSYFRLITILNSQIMKFWPACLSAFYPHRRDWFLQTKTIPILAPLRPSWLCVKGTTS